MVSTSKSSKVISAAYARFGTQRPSVSTGESAWLDRVLDDCVTYNACCIPCIEVACIREVDVVASEQLLVPVGFVRA